MSEKNVRRWVQALRSGEYDQARHTLYDGERGYCCLGVACQISGLGEFENVDHGEPMIVEGEMRYLGESECLPGEVMDWLGVGIPDPLLTNPVTGVTKRASVWNDEDGLSLVAIADLVEYTFGLVEAPV